MFTDHRFPGNLKYATSKETILAHFSACGMFELAFPFLPLTWFQSDPPPTVRLPTLKATEPTSKSKGYAFLEFTEKQGLQVALKLHHSELEGRKINVELTAGGGGKSERRLNKVKERNKGLHDQRVRPFRVVATQFAHH
jgi:nucleolar protein 6